MVALACAVLLLARLAAASTLQAAVPVHVPDPVAAAAQQAAQRAASQAAAGGPHAGTFADPLPLAPPPSTSPWLSIRDGQRELAAAAATLCRYRLDTWAAQRKLVLAYHEALADTGGRAPPGGVRPLQVGLCTASDDYVLDLWVIACAAPLHDALGADVAAAGCSCQLADGSLHAGCPTGLYGWRSTVQQPHLGQWVYAVVLANPPETGDEEGRRFTIDLDRVPPGWKG